MLPFSLPSDFDFDCVPLVDFVPADFAFAGLVLAVFVFIVF
jgi:hypothetical protein